VLGHHYRAYADTGQPKEPILDLSNLNPEATDLNLTILAAEEL